MALSVSITVNGTERNSVILFDSVQKQDNLNSEVDTFDFDVSYPNSQSWRPTVNSEVILTIGGTREFGGIITEISQRMDGHSATYYKVKCKDYSHLMDKMLVTERYEATTVQDFLRDILVKYASTFNGDNIEGLSLLPDVITFESSTVTQCFTDMARRYNYVWYVDYYKNVYFVAKNDVTAPFNLTDGGGNHIFDSLEFRQDFTQIRNRVRVVGGESETNVRTETHSGTGVKEEFALAYKYAEAPVVEVGGVPQTLGIDNIDDDASFDVMWSFQEKYLRFTAGNIPASGSNNVEVTGIPLLPLNVIVSDGVSISTYGIYEYKKEEDRLTTREDAIIYAEAELEAYKDPLIEGEFETYLPGLRSGQTISVNSSLLSVNDSFIITSVKLKLASRDKAIYSVQLGTSKTITLTKLLQELFIERNNDLSDLQSLFTFEQLFDDFSLTDSMTTYAPTTGPYYWADAATHPTKEMVWNKFVWE